ncbi:MAG: 2-oxoacid:ferredoxin oxidoreductase subunit beta [Candidatus Omnitrophica bacterium CG11_big_fil_rev_8_21_14_0_20_45_26]|uniref:2-oxoacid:ferredoxin oxidoreductase subunit beta n=1 Tax=Candidatus Abzuiibacterium crystallinum TaxID=1974748 RepID=A0A2H0LRB7_9BACT|nr:MAG: 2-oxoacid:ferredoxin oxidoreductase subunit beta [Candidatus Omnitrophica bacterium CG11_big_fil_rev_8_21_14_0_20_45_26]PIW65640.1 MAG: 2-oxoacid:ferredoxin oxidoreductase subunit beta [Candidatus Omnitrophica bacterium CG12_big_fil_rev_8_21_14_0_65_45_16]
MSTDTAPKPPQSRDDFISGQEVRWCPGCGDYAILATVQRTLAKRQIPREKYVFVSGIGCSSRFPYYMNTYGFHTIHGRAPTIATGLRCVNPELSIWVITGDGDGLSIGGNHLIHCMRRNVDLNILLVNNRIYGLTKGQYSPTSEISKVTKSTPFGSIEHPINALCIAIASEATFIARTLDTDPVHMSYVLSRAAEHRGISFVEIYQNCIIFNDKTFTPITGRDTRDDRMVYLEHGKPLVFGKKKNKAIKLNGLDPVIVDLDDSQHQKDLVIHDEKAKEPHYAYLLTQMEYPEMPVPFGVFRAIERPTYNKLMQNQIDQAVSMIGKGDLRKLIYGSSTWTVS